MHPLSFNPAFRRAYAHPRRPERLALPPSADTVRFAARGKKGGSHPSSLNSSTQSVVLKARRENRDLLQKAANFMANVTKIDRRKAKKILMKDAQGTRSQPVVLVNGSTGEILGVCRLTPLAFKAYPGITAKNNGVAHLHSFVIDPDYAHHHWVQYQFVESILAEAQHRDFKQVAVVAETEAIQQFFSNDLYFDFLPTMEEGWYYPWPPSLQVPNVYNPANVYDLVPLYIQQEGVLQNFAEGSRIMVLNLYKWEPDPTGPGLPSIQRR